MLCPGPSHCSHIADYVYNVCPLPDPDGVLWKQVVTVWHAGIVFQNVGPNNNCTVDFKLIVPICV